MINLQHSEHFILDDGLIEITTDKGPVLITVNYQIEAIHREQFLSLMNRLKTVRLRDGGYSWGLFVSSDAITENNAQTYMETFMVASWAEHLRQHDRATMDDKQLQQQLDKIISAKKVTHSFSAFSRKK